jgi:hypothetical protein
VIRSPATGHQSFSKVTSFSLAFKSGLMARVFRLRCARPLSPSRSTLFRSLQSLTTPRFPSYSLRSFVAPHRCRFASPIAAFHSASPHFHILISRLVVLSFFTPSLVTVGPASYDTNWATRPLSPINASEYVQFQYDSKLPTLLASPLFLESPNCTHSSLYHHKGG